MYPDAPDFEFLFGVGEALCDLRGFVARELTQLLANTDFSNSLPCLLKDALRVPIVLARLRSMSQGLD